jgi:hypothetical protein
LQGDGFATNDPRDCAADDYLLARDHSGHFALVTDYDFSGQYVTLNLPVDLKDTTTYDPQTLADDLEVVTDYRFFAS